MLGRRQLGSCLVSRQQVVGCRKLRRRLRLAARRRESAQSARRQLGRQQVDVKKPRRARANVVAAGPLCVRLWLGPADHLFRPARGRQKADCSATKAADKRLRPLAALDIVLRSAGPALVPGDLLLSSAGRLLRRLQRQLATFAANSNSDSNSNSNSNSNPKPTPIQVQRSLTLTLGRRRRRRLAATCCARPSQALARESCTQAPDRSGHLLPPSRAHMAGPGAALARLGQIIAST